MTGEATATGAAVGGPWGAAIGAGIDLIGGIIGQNSAKREAQKNRQFQERMSNTQYQRGMEDMRAAGLNPILAYKQGGASAPSGATASLPELPRTGSNYLMQRNLQEQNTLLQAQTQASTAQAANSMANARNTNAIAELNEFKAKAPMLLDMMANDPANALGFIRQTMPQLLNLIPGNIGTSAKLSAQAVIKIREFLQSINDSRNDTDADSPLRYNENGELEIQIRRGN